MTVATVSRVSRKTHAPLTLLATLSTAGTVTNPNLPYPGLLIYSTLAKTSLSRGIISDQSCLTLQSQLTKRIYLPETAALAL